MSNQKTTFEAILSEKGKLIYNHQGDSMFPLIREKDLLVIKPPSFPLKRLDIPLYRRDNGQYVLHRIIRVRKDDYVICGDNRIFTEKGISERHVIGVLTDIIRDGKVIPLSSKRMRLFSHVWCDLYPLRVVIYYPIFAFRVLKRKIKRFFAKRKAS